MYARVYIFIGVEARFGLVPLNEGDRYITLVDLVHQAKLNGITKTFRMTLVFPVGFGLDIGVCIYYIIGSKCFSVFRWEYSSTSLIPPITYVCIYSCFLIPIKISIVLLFLISPASSFSFSISIHVFLNIFRFLNVEQLLHYPTVLLTWVYFAIHQEAKKEKFKFSKIRWERETSFSVLLCPRCKI